MYHIHKQIMAIIHLDINNGFNPITYNGSFLPHGITHPVLHFTDKDAISPPSSPRLEGENEIRPRLLFHDEIWHRLVLTDYHVAYSLPKVSHKHHKLSSKKNMNKIFRKTHKLKQPGGASCNQRR